ncbi:MAG: hypothetical protein GY862_24485 [Gammaproteobacteria bacterium]|nr:hypothetical protein [Gammaproteobacteria bacterium]
MHNKYMEHRALTMSFLTAFITLGTQILIHRIVTAKLLNNYAFLVISLTMLGFAFSGMILSKHLKRFLEHLNEAVALCVSLFVFSLIACAIIFYKIPLGSQMLTSRTEFLNNFLTYMPFAVLFAIPFIFCGLILGALLASENFSTKKIYFFDLLGSAVGALVVLSTITWLGVEKNILLFLFLFIVGALFLLPPKGLIRWVVYGTVCFLAATAFLHDKLFEMAYPKDSMLSQLEIEHIAWDPIARIEVSRLPGDRFYGERFDYPCLVGGNTDFFRLFKKVITQNNYAFTFALDYGGDINSLTGIEETIYSAAYQAGSIPNPRVAVIGVGGGFDILTALYFQASEITGIEINSATLQILTRTYKDYFRHWVEDPKVRLIHKEGRHFLATTDQQYDVIQLSGVDSYAGTAASANIFSESYLYTKEAMALFFSKLSKNGMINMMRLEFGHDLPREMLRALTTTVAILREAGIQNPADHIVTLTAVEGNFTSMLVKKTPFTKNELSRLEKWVSGNKNLDISAAKGTDKPSESVYQQFLNVANPKNEERAIIIYPFNITPVGDDKPFFFRHSYWWHLFSDIPTIRNQSIPVMEYSLLILFALVGIISVLCIYLPLRGLAKKIERPKETWKYGTVLGAIGIGYLAVEISLMQRFGLFLGHPNYAISVVLASILFSTGLGSVFYQSILRKMKKIRYVSYLLAFIIFAEYFLVLPDILLLIDISFILKTIVVFALIFPIGILLGVYMPATIDRLKIVSSSFVPWAWGINGVFSVLSPILCIGLSISFGIGAVLMSAIPIYIIAGMFFPENKDNSTSTS